MNYEDIWKQVNMPYMFQSFLKYLRDNGHDIWYAMEKPWKYKDEWHEFVKYWEANDEVYP
jgi:hypothetical protein